MEVWYEDAGAWYEDIVEELNDDATIAITFDDGGHDTKTERNEVVKLSKADTGKALSGQL